MALHFVFWVFYLFVFNGIRGFNLDPRFSVLKVGNKGTYFGFSVAQHQIIDEKDNKIWNRLLIGAPKENMTTAGEKIGGAIYQCDATNGNKTECSMIIEDALKEVGEVADQWLGVTLASSGPGKKVVACAHRNVKRNAALGICHVLGPDLSHSEEIQPCSNLGVRLFMEDFGLCQAGMSAAVGKACAHRHVIDNSALGVCYTFLQTLKFDSMYKPCKRLSHNLYMQDFGLCQAGMSASVGKDDALVMGAPGSRFWRGAIFLTNITDDLGTIYKEIVSQHDDNTTPAKNYSYNGYAVTMGRFDETRTLYYVSGAPKSNIAGSVIFFRASPNFLTYNPSQILFGKLDFSGFGSSLLAVDLNNDGYDDLIVGAPYYYRSNVGGAIYIYYGGATMINNTNEPEEILSRPMTDVECQELKCEHSQFGFSLTKLGDINKDGYQDFAVGAPFEGKGAIYIYHGSPQPVKNYVQRIESSSLPDLNLTSFGYSLSGGLDLDSNDYPDLLVGAYESDAVVLIRSRPIIKLTPTLDVVPKAVNLDVTPKMCAADPKELRLCVEVTMCLTFKTKGTSSLVVPQVTYKLEAEPSRKISRVELAGSQDPSKKIIDNRNLTLTQATSSCVKEIAYLKENFEDRLNPIEFRFTFGLATDNKKVKSFPESAEQDINLFPVLYTEGSKDKVNSMSVEAEFVMECGDDNKCYSNLQFSVEFLKLFKDSQGVYEVIIGQDNQLNIAMNISNQGEAAYLTKVFIMKPKSLSYFGIQKEDTDSVSCQVLKENDTLIMCDQIGNPLKTTKELYFILKLNVPISLSASNEIHKIQAWINTTSIEKTPLNDNHELTFKIINKADIFLEANVEPDSKIQCKGESKKFKDILEDERSIGALVRHTFVVRNDGPGEVSDSFITISWPYELKNSIPGEKKYLLYLTKKPQLGGKVLNCDPIDDYINSENVKLIQNEVSEAGTVSNSGNINTEVKRTRRQAGSEMKSSGKVVVLRCPDSDKVKCFNFTCRIGKLEPQVDFAKITFEARLVESTLISEYLQASLVHIESWANVIIPGNLKITQDKSNDVKRLTTRAEPNLKDAPAQAVQWWIILVAVLVGLVVLLVVIFVLYKLGFFKRKHMEDMQMYKAEKKQQAMLDDYDQESS